MNRSNSTTTRRTFLGQALGAGAGVTVVSAATGGDRKKPSSTVTAIGSRRELFIDQAMIERLVGQAQRRLHHPLPREQVIRHDADWEGNASGYHTVLQDGDIYRMYYRGWHFEVSRGKLRTPRKPVTCYAESRDGIEWTKPELGLVEFKGSKKNNIILDAIGTHNFMPFVDENPACRPEARMKALAGVKSEGGLFAFQSADGVRWSLISDKPVITNGAFDSGNLAFWDPTIKQYRAYWRYFTAGTTTKENWKPAGNRAIRTGRSTDFLHWGHDANLAYFDSPGEQLYENQVKPYYRAPHILVGFPMRYVERGWSPSMRALPELEKREMRASSTERYGTAITESLLMASRDGVKFERWNEAFLRPGIQRDDSWFYAHQSLAEHVVETRSPLPGAPNELSLYAAAGYWHGKGTRMIRHTLRLDGFVSVSAPMKGGELVTRPLTFTGRRLNLNFASSAAGGLRVEIQTAAGKPIPGFSLEEAETTFGDEIERTAWWKSGSDVGRLAGKPVRLRFVLNDADLFAFRFVG